ncbi:Nuclease SbcCD subunit D [bioreactor metagenome]|uniref:Nuclease SbcCD subunit D n=1 Tax=bioreactor metagenome TaxID=1076179 RepID=A0A644SV80_9ZZZZ|nr:exonuclease SbcCD subunit D [Negativicutes bacterium]
MRFLHTSDWHLGRIFHGVHLTSDQAYILELFCGMVREFKPDAVVIAGDIYDRAVPPTEAVNLLDETLSRLLLDLKVPVIAIAGNHDSPERLGFGNRLLAKQGLHVVGQLPGQIEPVVINDKHGPVYFLPLTYAEPALVRERLANAGAVDHQTATEIMIAQAMAKVPANARKVAVAHAFIAGGEESESERPLSVGGSGMVSSSLFTPFNYTALGHLHNSQKAGSDTIRYSGSLLKYSFAEVGHNKGVNLVEIDGQGHTTVEVLTLAPRRDVRCVEGFFKQLLTQSAKDGPTNDYIMVTLQDDCPILDARGQLQAVYPNLLHIEYPRLNTGGQLRGPQADHRRLGEVELFSSFFEQMTGEKLTVDQTTEFGKVVDELYRQNREVQV